MIDTYNPAKLNEKISGRDSWNPAILNEAVTDRDSWNPAILNESAGETPVVFEATITASFPEGATCTATDGTTTLTADDNPMAFDIPNEGTWTVACVANGVTFSENVVITTNGQTETIDLTPIGDTYATTDSVPVLIACAGIGDSEITTIAGALADVETLTAILESENAIDYLVRSTTFASAVTADSVAMTGIGAINYDADTLLSDSTWLAAICNSTYFESVLNAKVPTMTSNTTPSGVARASSEYPKTGGAYYAFMAFDNSSSDGWISSTKGDSWIQYDFTNTIIPCKFTKEDVSVRFNTFKIQGSNDNESFTDLTETITNNTNVSGLLNSSNKYRYIRLQVLSNSTSQNDGIYGTTQGLQFYGRVDVN